MKRYIKDSGASLDYGWNWSSWLSIGEVIVDSTWTVPQGLTGSDDAFSDTITSIRLSGGTTGSVYSVSNRITTTSGQVDERTFQIRVQER